MQLFTIGLWKLNMDGSYVIDKETGERVPTYTNKNIMSFAKVWTGFGIQPFRGNLEGHRGKFSTNFIDPMRINGGSHDTLPKLGLDRNYLGDGVQLCSDIPSFSFLKKGAKYISVGAKLPNLHGSIPGDLDPTRSFYREGPNQHGSYNVDNPWTTEYKRLVPTTESALYKKLCGSRSFDGIPT